MPTMPQATGTLAQQIELVSDTPTDINVINLRFSMAAMAIKVIGTDLAEKLAQKTDPNIAERLEQEALKQIEALNGERAFARGQAPVGSSETPGACVLTMSLPNCRQVPAGS